MAERKELQLQGPRPSPLRVTKDSHKINKPPRPPPPTHHRPVIIYTVSPKIIHTEPTEFKDLVQRLTGLQPHGPSNDHQVPPETMSMTMSMSMSMSMSSTNTNSAMEHVVERVSHFPAGILSPTPGSLPPISSTIFTPTLQAAAAADLSPLTRFLQDLSPMAPNQFSSSLDNFFQNYPDHFH